MKWNTGRDAGREEAPAIQKNLELFSVTHTRNSQERGLARPGGGFGRMVRSSWYSAEKPGAQPSGTFSCQQAAN